MTDTTGAADPRVEAYIVALPAWQQDICREVRALLHAADPDVAETIKRTNRPYFVLQGNIAALQATTSSFTTAASPLIPQGSSPAATATRPGAPSPCARARH